MSTLTPKEMIRLVPSRQFTVSDRDAVQSTIAILVASGTVQTRPQLVSATALPRSTVLSALDFLIRAGIVVESGEAARPRRGRPAGTLKISSEIGFVMVADIGPRTTRIALARADQSVIAQDLLELDIRVGPEQTLDSVTERLRRLIAENGLRSEDARALVVSLPGPVDIRRGEPVRPPIMPGWDAYPVADAMTSAFGCPTRVDNDVNLMALGEARALPPDEAPLLMVSVGTGIGGGLVTGNGELHHGADGAACDIGHIRVPEAVDDVCNCGNIGCIEAIASAEAIARRLCEAKGLDKLTETELEQLVREGDSSAVFMLREAARKLGGVVATLVHLYNPAHIVIGGALSAASDDLLAGIRSVVYQTALPLATRNLTLTRGILGSYACLTGGIIVGIEEFLSPAGINRMVSASTS